MNRVDTHGCQNDNDQEDQSEEESQKYTYEWSDRAEYIVKTDKADQLIEEHQKIASQQVQKADLSKKLDSGLGRSIRVGQSSYNNGRREKFKQKDEKNYLKRERQFENEQSNGRYSIANLIG